VRCLYANFPELLARCIIRFKGVDACARDYLICGRWLPPHIHTFTQLRVVVSPIGVCGSIVLDGVVVGLVVKDK
jgi:hypothetical protein